jgi:Metalloenzyme superfamily
MSAVCALKWLASARRFALTTPLVFTCCVTPPASSPAAATEGAPIEAIARPALRERTRGVVIVVIDGARWQEVFGGVDRRWAKAQGMSDAQVVDAKTLMPNLHAVIENRGVALGAPRRAMVTASGPNFISLPGYTEILSGREATGCRDNDCPAAVKPTLVDEIRSSARAGQAGPAGQAGSAGQIEDREVAVISSWEPIGRIATARPSTVVLSNGRHGGNHKALLRDDPAIATLLDEGERADAWPGNADYRPDRVTGALATQYLNTHRPRFLFVGLGDTDEYGHHGDYPAYLRALTYADKVIGDIVASLDAMGEDGKRTTLVVTCDHGRAADFRGHGGYAPESGRAWLVMAGGGVQPRGLLDREDTTRLRDIAPTIRVLMGLPTDDARGTGQAIAEIWEQGEPADRLAAAP